jgi:hypothetical protein
LSPKVIAHALVTGAGLNRDRLRLTLNLAFAIARGARVADSD